MHAARPSMGPIPPEAPHREGRRRRHVVVVRRAAGPAVCRVGEDRTRVPVARVEDGRRAAALPLAVEPDAVEHDGDERRVLRALRLLILACELGVKMVRRRVAAACVRHH